MKLSLRNIAVIVLSLIVGGYMFCSSFKGSAEKRVRKVLDRATQAAAHGDVPAMMQLVSRDYSDDLGLNYEMLTAVVFRTFKKYKDVNLEFSNLEVTKLDKGVQATFSVRAEATDSSTMGPGKLPDRPVYVKDKVLARFVDESGDFRLAYSVGVDPKEWGDTLQKP